MGQVYRPGLKLHSAVCDTQIMVLRVPNEELEISCGGAPMSGEAVADKGAASADLSGGTLVGKRYTDAEETMEFLCTKGGDGTITVAGYNIDIKAAKKLPSSD